MMRYAACVEYDGARFSGWQAQAEGRTVQCCVEQALSKVANHPVGVVCAGRTDAGVHALGQVIHFESDAARTTTAWLRGTNANLPKEIALVWVQSVSESFHARFSAVARRYRYVIFNRDVRPSFLAQRCSWDYRSLDEQRMNQAAQYLIGEHDFSSYRAVACQAKSPVRTLTRLQVTRRHDLLFIDVEANAFLHHMVRNIAGVLMAIGAGEHEPIWAREVLEARDRTLGGVTAHPSGLYFMEAIYPAHFAIPRAVETAMVW